MTNRERFETILTGHYRELFQSPDYAMAAARTTPEALAHKMTGGILTGFANHDGEGIRRTCRDLGIRFSESAIREFLQANKAPARGVWRRVPTVTTGGKSCFWVGTFPGRRLAIVWDRAARGWRMHYGPNYELRGSETFRKASEAKRSAEQFATSYPSA